jgi:hypothetical protein
MFTPPPINVLFDAATAVSRGAANKRHQPARRLSSPEIVQGALIVVVATDLDDPPVLDSHELACRHVKPPPFMLGCGLLHGNDVLIADADVQEAGSKGSAGARSELREEVVADGRPATMGACDGALPGKSPDGCRPRYRRR